MVEWWSGVMSVSKVIEITHRNPLVVGMCTFSDAEFRYGGIYKQPKSTTTTIRTGTKYNDTSYNIHGRLGIFEVHPLSRCLKYSAQSALTETEHLLGCRIKQTHYAIYTEWLFFVNGK